MWITDIYCITIDMWITDILLCSCLQYVFDNTTEEGCDVVVSLSQNDRTLERRNNRTMTNLHIGFTIMKVQLSFRIMISSYLGQKLATSRPMWVVIYAHAFGFIAVYIQDLTS